MHVRTTSRDLAQWLEEQGGHWHVEGEPALARSLPMPSPASTLVDVLRKRDGVIAVLVPDASTLRAAEDAPIAASDLASTAHVVDGQRVFQLAWIGPDGAQQDSWLLAEQRGTLRQSDPGAGAARQVLDAFRARGRAASS